ncbi:MAG: hypothetical protein B0D91_09065, partial [Oceanospirillales bacterium LUC14_002_19_P2]
GVADMSDPSEVLIYTNQSSSKGYFCCNPSLFIRQPVKAPVLNNVTDFFISFSASDVLYPEISPGVTAPEAKSGFWMNMDSGLSAATDNYQHPDNYYEGHPIYEVLKNIITADGLTWTK